MRKFLLLLFTATSLTSCSSSHMLQTSYFETKPSPKLALNNTPSSQVENPEFWEANIQSIWKKLQQVPLEKLKSMEATQTDPTQKAWVSLAIISKRYSVNLNELTQKLMTWRQLYPQHPGNRLFPDNTTLSTLATSETPQNIAVLLPLTGKFAGQGASARNGFMNAYYQTLSKTSQHQNIVFYDTNLNPDLTSLYQQAVDKGANVIIGPLTKQDVRLLSVKGIFSVPTIALNYADNPATSTSNLYQFGLSPQDEAQQVADKAREAGLARALLIAPQNEWGQTLARALTMRWQANGGTIVDSYLFTDRANFSADIAKLLRINIKEDIAKTRALIPKTELAQQGRHDYDVIFLLTPAANARQIVPILRFYYVDKTPIYATSAVYTGRPDPQRDADLNGIIFCDTPGTLVKVGSTDRLTAVGHDAFYISHDLKRFTALSNFPLYGATGSIHLNEQNQFYRRLAWAQFRNGHP